MRPTLKLPDISLMALERATSLSISPSERSFTTASDLVSGFPEWQLHRTMHLDARIRGKVCRQDATMSSTAEMVPSCLSTALRLLIVPILWFLCTLPPVSRDLTHQGS